MAYVDGVLSGAIIAGEDLQLACRRFLDFRQREDLDFRTHDADFVIGIIESTFHHRQGQDMDAAPMRGKPLILQPWQKFCVYGMLGFFHKGTPVRLCKEAFIFIPRKNG